eukprot:3876435-Amphidinium_carterae.1
MFLQQQQGWRYAVQALKEQQGRSHKRPASFRCRILQSLAFQSLNVAPKECKTRQKYPIAPIDLLVSAWSPPACEESIKAVFTPNTRRDLIEAIGYPGQRHFCGGVAAKHGSENKQKRLQCDSVMDMVMRMSTAEHQKKTKGPQRNHTQ